MIKVVIRHESSKSRLWSDTAESISPDINGRMDNPFDRPSLSGVAPLSSLFFLPRSSYLQIIDAPFAEGKFPFSRFGKLPRK